MRPRRFDETTAGRIGSNPYGVPVRAYPREWTTLSFEEVVDHRYLGCPHYDRCLHLASEERWDAFTCRFCSLWALDDQLTNPYGCRRLRQSGVCASCGARTTWFDPALTELVCSRRCQVNLIGVVNALMSRFTDPRSSFNEPST